MPHSGSRRIALACCVSTSVTWILKSSMSWSVTSPPRSFASDFFREPRWSIAAAAMTPRASATAFMPASLPGVIFIRSVYNGETVGFHGRGLDCGLDDLVDRQPLFRAFHFEALRFRRRVLGREQGAAVLVGDDRDRIRAETFRLSRDLLLVQTDQGPQDGNADDAADRRHVLDRLRGDLPDDFAGHQRMRAVQRRNALGDPHHQPAI